eukprot:sb/3466609/
MDEDEDYKSQLSDDTQINLRRQQAIRMIERAWCSFRDRRMFKVLKRSICSAENSVTNEVLKKLNPKEAEVLNDPTMSAKVRFRFGGEEFPPIVMFKVFVRVGSSSSKYISGKKMIKADSDAARDALKLMGNRRYYDQLISDAAQCSAITDEMDVATLRDFMILQSHEDELPSYLGGRHNQWRELTLENLTRRDVMYDVVDYIKSGKRSDRLRSEFPTLPIRSLPSHSQPAQYDCLRRLLAYKKKATSGSDSARRSQQAKRRVARMRRLYGHEDFSNNGNTTYYTGKEESGPSYFPELNVTVSDEEDWENEASQLYQWSQELSFNEQDPEFAF